ncbi:SDR family NAD(P)-dependent oxidoreductase, partial [Enterococcus casseliflavus]|uniref:SDR family NAD(P)-dependent oxidoreductase n=1 Tax=Enterococcus casseliflavus TaxID=37734 RepID=UPI003D1515D6
RVETALCDVGDPADVTRALAATLDAFGRVDACYANAGVGGAAASFDGMTDEEWRRVLRVNLDGVFYTFRAVVGHMLARGGGG